MLIKYCCMQFASTLICYCLQYHINKFKTIIIKKKTTINIIKKHLSSGKPWLWARFDRKPTKGAEKRFRKWQTLRQKQGLTGDGDTHGMTPTFQWDMQKDFKVLSCTG